MKLSDIVFVPSPQHTGLWFTIKFLNLFIPKIRELTFLLESGVKDEHADVNYIHKYEYPLDEPTIVHIHFPIVQHLNFDVNYPTNQFQRRWYANLATLRAAPVQTILMFCNFFKTVIPIRDPFAAILTREARHPQFRHFFIVDNFVALATEFAQHPNVKFLPIDMVDSVEQRRSILLGVLKHCSIEPVDELVNMVATKWIPENVTPGNRFKKLYEEGKIDELRMLLGPKWAEVEYLKKMSSLIMPFMSELGYSRKKMFRGL